MMQPGYNFFSFTNNIHKLSLGDWQMGNGSI